MATASLITLILLSTVFVTTVRGATDPGHHNDSINISDHHEAHGIHVVSWNFHYVEVPFIILIFLLSVVFIMLAFHHCHALSTYLPESCLLIIIGVVVGIIVYFLDDGDEGIEEVFTLLPQDFMLYLLPPIILHASYDLNDRVFANNLFTILLYAVFGTIISCFTLGPLLYGLAKAGAMGHIEINFIQCLLFASMIVAVDPVAVLAIFQEVKVNDVLYFLVFGESLLNDAVTVVLYNMMKTFNNMDEIPGTEIGKGIGSFFTVSLGGLVIGLIFGAVTALVTKKSSKHAVLEPLIVTLMAYGAYIFAELFHWSGIISMIGCGLIQAQFALPNITKESEITVRTFVHMISTTLEAIIFLYLGIELVRTIALDLEQWHTGFVLWSLLLCLIIRFVVVGGLTLLANWNRNHKIGIKDVFIMWYGGLRGAVCFALCATLSKDFPLRSLFLITTFVVILFTVFVQGITMKPMVTLCKIARKPEGVTTLAEEIQSSTMDYIMTGIECITDQQGENYFRVLMYKLGDWYLRPLLLKNPVTHDASILEKYREIRNREHEEEIEKFQMVTIVKANENNGLHKRKVHPETDDKNNEEKKNAESIALLPVKTADA